MTLSILLKWLSLRHLLSEKRHWLTLVGVALGISVFISIRIANESLLDAFQQSVDTFAGNTTLEIIGRGGPMDELVVVELRKEPAILEMAPIVHSAFPVLSPASAEGEVLLLMGVDLLQEGAFRSYQMGTVTTFENLEGQDAENSRIGGRAGEEGLLDFFTDASAVFLTDTFAKRHQLQIGDSFSVRNGDKTLVFRLAGLLRGKGIAQVHDGNIALLDIASAQWHFAKLGRLDRIDLITDPMIPSDEMIKKLTLRLGENFLVRRPQQRGKQVEKMLFSFQMNLTALSAISLFVGLLLIYNTLLVSVVHRRKEIGLLRTLGVSSAKIFWLFTLEGGIIGALGGFFGIFAGALLARWVIELLSKTVTALYVSIPPYPFSLPLPLFLEGVVIGVVVSIFSAVYPAWQASLMKPREALEGIYGIEKPVRHIGLCIAGLICGLAACFFSQVSQATFAWAGYLSAALLLVAFSLIVPASLLGFSKIIHPLTRAASFLSPSWRLAQGHFEQAIRRNAPTISAFMGALAMMISVVVMIESFRTTVVLWIDQTIQSDIIGFPASYMTSNTDETLPEGILDEISTLEEIKAVDGYRSFDILFQEEPVHLVGRDLSVHAAHSQYLFQSGNSISILQEAIEEKKVLISEVLANRFNLQKGETIDIASPQGKVSFEIGGIFYEYSTDGGKIVIDRSVLKTVWDHQSVNKIDLVSIYLEEGLDADAVRSKLLKTWGRSYGLSFTTQSAFKNEILDIFDQTFLITYALEWIAIVVALLGITNTLFVSILERRREIAIFRSIGASRNQVVHVVLIEAFYMGLLGNVLGLACAYFLSLLLIFVINKASFGWTLLYQFPPEVFLHSFLLASGTALLAGYFPAKKAAQMNLKEAIAYE